MDKKNPIQLSKASALIFFSLFYDLFFVVKTLDRLMTMIGYHIFLHPQITDY